jgi:predicted DNA-binding protein
VERKTQSVKLPIHLYKRLRQEADRRGTFISRLLKLAVEEYFGCTVNERERGV